MKKFLPSFSLLGSAALLLSLLFVGCDNSGGNSAGASATNAVDQAPASTNAAAASASADAAGKAKKPDPPLFISGATFRFRLGAYEYGEEGLQLKMPEDECPDMDRISEYVSIEPSPAPLSFKYVYWQDSVYVSGRFRPDVEYRVEVRQGLPMRSGRATATKFVRTFNTGSLPPSVRFASSGRYLPSVGRRMVQVKTANVGKLKVRTYEVPERNVVQLLAREERRYNRYYGGGGDSEDTRELAGKECERVIALPERRNEEVVTPIQVQGENGMAEKGVYLVSVADDDMRCDGGSRRFVEDWRLVCVTDIGLSVRETKDCVYVWTTSLTTGRPMKDVCVRLCTPSNVLLSDGVTDADGWCALDKATDKWMAIDRGEEPFAVVATRRDTPDVSFIALNGKWNDETPADGSRREFVEKDGVEAFVWTERGIYRHNEKIFVQAILRNGKCRAPNQFPVEFTLSDPEDNVRSRATVMSDRFGSAICEKFSVPEEMRSGVYTIRAKIPGEDGENVIGERQVKIEEFVPPQIRVKVDVSDDSVMTNIGFTVSAEHLFGGVATGLNADGAVMFADAPFKPKGWDGFSFGDSGRHLNPNFMTFRKTPLDNDGRLFIRTAEGGRVEKIGRPAAAVKATLQGTVFENGGRGVSARASRIMHFYPHYVGVKMPASLRRSEKPVKCEVALVRPDGTAVQSAAADRSLSVKVERVDYVYSLKKLGGGRSEWVTDKIRLPVGEVGRLAVGTNGLATLELPVPSVGDYVVTVRDEEADVAFSAGYWVGGRGDDSSLRASLSNPTKLELAFDKKVYYVGDRPRLTVKAPFAGSAWLSVMRDKMVYSQVLRLERPTGEFELQPVTEAWAPGVDVSMTVVQACKAGARHVANRAFGIATMRTSVRDREFDVSVKPSIAYREDGGANLTASLAVGGANAKNARAVVTVVDEGINMLTSEKTPDPIGWFGAVREMQHPFYDIFNYLLPVIDDSIRRSGAKTGGGAEGDMFRRLSPQPTRRFKPLSVWQKEVKVVNGKATVKFSLPEFAGEARVTAVVYDGKASGAASSNVKITPRLVMQPDAPRFSAPDDVLEAVLTLSNRSGADGEVRYDVSVSGAGALEKPASGKIVLNDGASQTMRIPVRAGQNPGEAKIAFRVEGLGERHSDTILLPVRPGAPWVGESRTVCIPAGGKVELPNPAANLPEFAQRRFSVSKDVLGELTAAIGYLVGYPHGCLEQTTSRAYPLVAAGGILNKIPASDSSIATDASNVVQAAIARVVSMQRSDDFVMWPDCDTRPWKTRYSLWASEFLIASRKAGFNVPGWARASVTRYLRNFAVNKDVLVSSYACHLLAMASVPDVDTQLRLFDGRTNLPMVAKCHLARAFTASGDRTRAKELAADLHPDDVVSASLALLAILELDPKDARLPGLAAYINSRRDKSQNHWGTTESNAHALLALATFNRTLPLPSGEPDVILKSGDKTAAVTPKRAFRMTGGGTVVAENRGTGAAYLTASSVSLPDPKSLKPVSSGISVERRFLDIEGKEVDMANLSRGDLLIAELTFNLEDREYEDLVVEDLLPGCFEPDPHAVDGRSHQWDAFAWMKEAEIEGFELRRDFRDDRFLLFSTSFTCEADADGKRRARAYYAVRVVGAGDFLLPGVSVEAMYAPDIHARSACGRVRVAK